MMRTHHLNVCTIVALLSTIATIPLTAGAQDVPRTADGHPDLSGYWLPINAVVRDSTDADGNIDFTLPARDNDIGNFEKDFAVLERAKPNKPLYRPEHWDRIQDLDWNGLTIDPIFSCRPAGVPRQGPPHKIVQTPTEIIFLYERRGNVGPSMFRVIPIDGREHLPAQINDTSWHGYGIGHWEGDTLVIESVGFNDESWLGWTGYIHSWDMKVTERIRREGNVIHWEATVEDPEYLLEPWTLDPVRMRLNEDPNAFFFDTIPCEERDAEHIVEPHGRG